MSDEELPEIVIPDDEIAVRAQPPTQRDRFPERAVRFLVAAEMNDGTLMTYEFPDPEQVTVEIQHLFDEPEGSWYLQDYFIRNSRPPVVTFKIETYDRHASRHHGRTKPHPGAAFTMTIRPPGTWRV